VRGGVGGGFISKTRGGVSVWRCEGRQGGKGRAEHGRLQQEDAPCPPTGFALG